MPSKYLKIYPFCETFRLALFDSLDHKLNLRLRVRQKVININVGYLRLCLCVYECAESSLSRHLAHSFTYWWVCRLSIIVWGKGRGGINLGSSCHVTDQVVPLYSWGSSKSNGTTFITIPSLPTIWSPIHSALMTRHKPTFSETINV